MTDTARRRRVRGRLQAGVAAAVIVFVAGSLHAGWGSSKHARVSAPLFSLTATPSHRGTEFDAVDIRLSGAQPGATVTVSAAATDGKGVHWTSSATFHADPAGVVDLGTQAPLSGSYSGVDEMGLVWSMSPPPGSTAWSFKGFPDPTITASEPGGYQATLDVGATPMAAGETTQALTVAHDGFEGHFFRPAPAAGAKPRPAVITIGGSEGGEATIPFATALAAEGYPALSVGYFSEPGTPPDLKNIPLEYFVKAASWLAGQPGVDRAHILVQGGSRGTEAALLLAQDFPSLVHGAILYSPGATVLGSFPDQTGDAWTLHGAPAAALDTPIPVDKVDGPVLAFAGDDDQVWSSGQSANEIMDALNRAHDPYPHKATGYADAGHFVDAPPYVPLLTSFSEDGQTATAGGTRQGDAAAQSDAWRQVLTTLAGLEG